MTYRWTPKFAWLGVAAALALVVGTATPANAQCPTSVWELTAGQHIDVGSVEVSNDSQNVYFTYSLDTITYPDASFGTLHVWVGTDINLVPANGQGVPVPGQFDKADGGASFDASGLTEYTFTIPFDSFAAVNISELCGGSLFVFTHAEVGLGDSSETAWGGPNPVNVDEPGRWYYYGAHTICCEEGPPGPEFCETAFAKGGFVFTTGKRSNPEGLPSLELTRNRWGWAIHLDAEGFSSYEIWAGAGLNNTSKGYLVGTLSVDWHDGVAVVTYEMADGASMEEAHLYAGDTPPTTLAPGQYGNIADLEPGTIGHSFVVSLEDTDGDGVWLIAHAVVCR